MGHRNSYQEVTVASEDVHFQVTLAYANPHKLFDLLWCVHMVLGALEFTLAFRLHSNNPINPNQGSAKTTNFGLVLNHKLFFSIIHVKLRTNYASLLMLTISRLRHGRELSILESAEVESRQKLKS